MRRCLREKVCFFCGKPEGGCSHLLAVVDRTFGTIDRGSLAPLLAELVESLGKAGEENALEVLVEELRYVASWVSLAENDSDAAMSASRVDYFWGDAAKVEARLRADFSG